ncbi:hypothetical protein DFH94DRAFT_71719 [Russula ochroleuca]|uniref:Uncharacterized protein n=1 Tax=Russula ochroleuca TaxID=152965 RepID=A0A9P5T696_9AGAM|nr:hypothetical protein DFH94DRAFT_71719 [Russula ochroleuca]
MPRRKNLPNGALELTFHVDAAAEPPPNPSSRKAALGPVIEAVPGCEYQPNPAPHEPLPLASADPPARRKNARNTRQTATILVKNKNNLCRQCQPDPASLEPLLPNTVVVSRCATPSADPDKDILSPLCRHQPISPHHNHSTSVRVDVAPLPALQAQSPIADEAFNPFLQQPMLALDPPSSPSISAQFWSLASPTPSPHARRQPQNRHHSIVRSPRPLPTRPVGNKQCHAATDVWTFYEEGPKQNVCLLCARLRLECVKWPRDMV